MPQYDYKCTVCSQEFTLDKPMSEHRNPEDCEYCYSKESAKQVFSSEHAPSVKVWDNPILKNISYD